MFASSEIVMALLEAVNGPMVVAGDGSVSVTPVAGTGEGRGASILGNQSRSAPVWRPLASTDAVARARNGAVARGRPRPRRCSTVW